MGRAGGLGTGARWIGRAGPLLVLPALFFFAYAVAWRLSARSHAPPAGAGELSTAASHGEPEDVGGFLGSLALDEAGGAGVLRARLVPLRSAPAAQAFDAVAIARRLGEERGEPWRLELAWDAAAGAGSYAEAPLALGDVRVEGDGGARLAPLPPLTTGAAPVDPLRTLLARSAPTLRLAAGASVQIVLFGEPPGDSARLVVARGTPEEPGEPGEPGELGELELLLVPGRVRTDELERSIARAPRVEREAARR